MLPNIQHVRNTLITAIMFQPQNLTYLLFKSKLHFFFFDISLSVPYLVPSMWNKLLMTVHACVLEWMPLLSTEGRTRGASQCFPHSFSSQEVCAQRKARNRMFSLKLTALPDSEEGLLTADKRELSAHRPEWKVLFGDHTDIHTEFQLSTVNWEWEYGPGWPYSHSHPRWTQKKRPPQLFSAGYSVPLLHILCARKKINKEKNTQLHKLPYYNGKRVRCKRKKDMTHNSTVRPFKATSEYWKRRAWDSIPLGFLDVCQQWSAFHCGSPQAVRFKLFEGLKIISVSELPKGKQRPQSACWLHYCGRSLLRRDQYSSPQCTGSERVPVRAGSSQWTR